MWAAAAPKKMDKRVFRELRFGTCVVIVDQDLEIDLNFQESECEVHGSARVICGI